MSNEVNRIMFSGADVKWVVARGAKKRKFFTVLHDNPGSAMVEAERLAREVGGSFYVYELKAVFHRPTDQAEA